MLSMWMKVIDDDSGSDQPLIRELDLDIIAAQATDELLESTTEHTDQDSATIPCSDLVLAPRREGIHNPQTVSASTSELVCKVIVP